CTSTTPARSVISSLSLHDALPISAIGCICGVTAGHFYYYRDLRLNIFGMLLHVAANVFDNADGQLARLTNQTTRMGRLIDGVAEDRKSTRLNSSHVSISYAVFCLK